MTSLPLTSSTVAHALAQAAVGAALLVLLSLPWWYRTLGKIHPSLGTPQGAARPWGLVTSALLFLVVAWWALALWDAAVDPETDDDDDVNS